VIVYISIGNSDDKLTQNEWAHFVEEVSQDIRGVATAIHGAWLSHASDPWQNACWCADIGGPDSRVPWLRKRLAELAAAYRQDSITWAETPSVDFIRPGDE
jgi:hypothetical protein